MARYDGRALAQEQLLNVAASMVQAALKASQTTGRVKVQAEIITGEDLVPIIELLGKMSKISQYITWDYMTFKEAYEAGTPPILVLLGADTTVSEMAWNCGACGFPTCKEFNRYSRENKGQGMVAGGPSCNWKVLDLGIAADWAAATAWQHNADNRVQGSSGGAAAMLGYLPDCSSVIGIPIGPCREMVWYSRETMHRKFSYEQHVQTMFNTIPTHFMDFAGGGRPNLKRGKLWWDEHVVLQAGTNEAAEEKAYEVLLEMAEVIDRYSAQVAEHYNSKERRDTNG